MPENQSTESSGAGAPAADQSQRDIPSTSSSNQGAPAKPAPGDKQDSTQSVANPEAQKYAQEAALQRTRVKELEAQLKAHDDATLTAQQKLERDYAETQAKALEYEAETTRLRVENEGYRLAGKLGVSDIAGVIGLVNAEHSADIETDEAGKPKNLEKLIRQVLADHPGLAGTPPRPGASSGGATNPGAASRTGTFTRDQIAHMSPQEYAANRDSIMETLKRGDLPR